MRDPVDAGRIRQLMEALGRAAHEAGRVYLTGGGTAVLMGWRASTIDVDVKFVPDNDAILRAIPGIKEDLRLNIELASPVDFIPVPEGWEERSTFIDQLDRLSFFHFDLYAQAMAKVERGHEQDLADVQAMQTRGLIDAERALEYFDRLEPDLYRYPAIHAPAFRRAVEDMFRS
ncbi:MAG: hypothetical protein IH876_12685 [Gemmatimonadetes bacterium]|nr:hypothetical protein [Gemmatimonadota bacterium]